VKPLEIIFNSWYLCDYRATFGLPYGGQVATQRQRSKDATSLVILTCLDKRLVLAAMPMICSSFVLGYFI